MFHVVSLSKNSCFHFENLFIKIYTSSLETRVKILSPDCYNFKNLSVLFQRDPCLKLILSHFDSCLECKSVSHTMVYTPCFEDVYHNMETYQAVSVKRVFKSGASL